jgi:hypothetical protein
VSATDNARGGCASVDEEIKVRSSCSVNGRIVINEYNAS